MRECIEACVGQSRWMVYLPVAWFVLSHVNAALRVPKAKRAGLRRVLDFLDDALNRISIHSRHDAPGTLKLPGTSGRRP